MNVTFAKIVNNARYLFGFHWLCELDLHHSELVGWAHPTKMHTRCKRCGKQLTLSFEEEIELDERTAQGTKS